MVTDDYAERRRHHTWRWRLLSVWIVVFSSVVIFSVVQLRHQANDIQSQRRTSVRAACEQTNSRHDNTLRELDTLLAVAERGANKARVAQLEASKVSTILLINALAPKQDCAKIVKKAVRGG